MSIDGLSESGAGRGIHQRANIGQTPYKTVAAAFSTFSHPFYDERTQRGGVIRAGKTGIHKGMPVEMTWTEEQLPYVLTTMSYLTALSKGETFVEDTMNTPIRNLSSGIQDDYSYYKNKYHGQDDYFRKAVSNNIHSMFYYFMRIYPNLTPALSATMELAGYEGTQQLLTYAKLLELASQGRLKAEDLGFFKESERHLLEHETYFMVHQRRTIGETDEAYQLRCSGETFAITVAQQIKDAAVKLGVEPKSLLPNIEATELNTEWEYGKMEHLRKEIDERHSQLQFKYGG